MKAVTFLWCGVVLAFVSMSEGRLGHPARPGSGGPPEVAYEVEEPEEIAEQFASDTAKNYVVTAQLTESELQVMGDAVRQMVSSKLPKIDGCETRLDEVLFPISLIKVNKVVLEKGDSADSLILSITVPKAEVTGAIADCHKWPKILDFLPSGFHGIKYVFDDFSVELRANYPLRNEEQVVESARILKIDGHRIGYRFLNGSGSDDSLPYPNDGLPYELLHGVSFYDMNESNLARLAKYLAESILM